jgi:hypothetical protein
MKSLCGICLLKAITFYPEQPSWKILVTDYTSQIAVGKDSSWITLYMNKMANQLIQVAKA